MYSCPNEADFFFLHWCKDGAGSLLDLIISSSYVPNITSSLELPNIVRIVYMILPENMGHDRSIQALVWPYLALALGPSSLVFFSTIH